MHIKLNTKNNYIAWLWVISTLFCFRVIAQLLVSKFEIGFLPSFENWHSGTMPYWVLLLMQIVILIIMVRTNYNVSSGNLVLNPLIGKIMVVIGVIYFLVMLLRLGLGLTLFSEDRWFSNFVPTFFHFVLASWVLLVGLIHSKQLHKEM